MKQRLSRLAQLREDFNVALVLLLLGIVLGAFSLIPPPPSTSSTSHSQPSSTTP